MSEIRGKDSLVIVKSDEDPELDLWTFNCVNCGKPSEVYNFGGIDEFTFICGACNAKDCGCDACMINYPEEFVLPIGTDVVIEGGAIGIVCNGQKNVVYAGDRIRLEEETLGTIIETKINPPPIKGFNTPYICVLIKESEVSVWIHRADMDPSE